MYFHSSYLYLIPALPLAGFMLYALLALIRARSGKKTDFWASMIGVSTPMISFAIAVWSFFALKGGEAAIIQPEPLFTWLSTTLFKIDFSFMLDPLSAVMILVITGVGSLIHIYSVGYMKGDKGFERYFAYLNLFLFFMLLLVLGDNLLILFIGWEGVGLCSYLLIGFWFDDPEKAAAGKKAFIVNRIGDFGFLIGLFFILYAFISQSRSSDLSFFDYSFMLAHKEIFAPYALVITLCLFAGATGKSAQIPLYIWLPDAMAGPTPVSALIHAATMVTAGVYMVARLYFLYAMAPLTLDLIAGVGLATALIAALIAVTQYDIKKVLAYSTVSQLGFMFISLGNGAPEGAIFHLVTHAFFKACLFLGAGSVIIALHHEQDIRKMGGLFSKMPVTAIAFLISTLAIAGIPPFSGFFSKDEILWNVYQNSSHLFYLATLFTAGLTAFYMFRLFVYVFLGSFRGKEAHPVPLIMNIPVGLLALLAAAGGLLGIPESLGGGNILHHFLALSSHGASVIDHAGLERGLMLAATVWALIMSLSAFFLYRKNLDWATSLKKRGRWFYELSVNKFYVDEFYQKVVVTPLCWLSRNLLWKGSDQTLIDGFGVNGLGTATRWGAALLSRFQTGVLGHYLVFLWVGLGFLLWLIVKK